MGCLCQKSFSALLFMHQISNPCRGRRLDDPMPPTAARQQSAIFYGVSLQQRYADCPFATIVYIICADSVSSGASSRRTLQKYLLKESFFIQIFLRYVQLPTKKFPRGVIILFYSSVFISLSLNKFFRRSVDDELSAVFESINALSAAI